MFSITHQVIVAVFGYIMGDIRSICACMATGGNAGGAAPTIAPTVAPTVTPTPTSECAPMAGQVPLYQDTSYTVGNALFGSVPPSSTCATCATGQALYYPDSGNAVPAAANNAAIGGLTCANMCICQVDGTCFQRTGTNQQSNVVLYPFCNGADCQVYAVVVSQGDTDGIVSTNGATTFTQTGQTNPTTLAYRPVTDNGIYPRITSASCNGCNFQMSCDGGPSP